MKNIDIIGLVICYITFFSRLIFPYAIYLFIFCIVTYTFLQIVTNRKLLLSISCQKIGLYLKLNWTFFSVCFFFIIGNLMTKNLSFYLLKEGIGLFLIVLLSLFTFLHLNSVSKFYYFFNLLKKALYASLIISSILSPIKFYFELTDYYFDFLRVNWDRLYPIGTALIIDYNFFSLMNITGLIFLFFDLGKFRKGSKESIKIQIFMFLLFNNIFFSSSRRASILLFIVTAIWLVVLPLYNYLKRKKETSLKFNFRFPSFYFILLCSFYLIFFTFLKADSKFQTSVLKTVNIKSVNYNGAVSAIFARYMTIVKVDEGENTKNSLINESNELSGNRIVRLKYAFTLYSNYSLFEKVFGKGFDYMTLYGEEFYSKKGQPFHYDYPHNPILSSLLYSGIIGLSFVLFFLFQVFKRIYRHFKKMMAFGLIILSHFYFISFSGNSLFGTPEFLLLVLILTQYHILVENKFGINDEASCINE